MGLLDADQLTSTKKTELMKRIEREKPRVCEMKPKNSKEYEIQDYDIPDYTIHPVNLNLSSCGRGIAIFIHTSIEKSSIQVQPELAYEEACLLELKLRGGDTLLFACFYRSPTPTEKSDDNNTKLNNLLRSISRKKYSRYFILGDFNYRDINW